MKKIKLSLDKLVVGSLTAAEQKAIIGGYEGSGGSTVTVNGVCITSAPTYKSTSILAGCPQTPAPTEKCATGPMNSCL